MCAFSYKEMKFINMMMATMRIYGKNPLQIFPETSGPISMKLDMKHHGNKKYIIVYPNGEYLLTLTYFTARSNFLT